MDRSALVAALAACALVLSACGSNGAADAPASASSPAGNSAAADGAGSANAAPEGSAADQAGSAAASGDAGSSGTGAASPPDTAASPDGAGQSSPAVEPATGSPATGTDATATIGDASGTLDAASVAWVDTLCTGVKPVADLRNIQSTLNPADPAATKQTLVDAIARMGTSFTDTAAALARVPPPSFEGGDEFADAVIDTFATYGPKLTETAAKLAAADASDGAAVNQALASIGTDAAAATAPLQGLERLAVTPETSAAINAIPSCAAIG